MKLSIVKSMKIEEPLYSAIFAFIANEDFIDGEEETGKNRSSALTWSGNHLAIISYIEIAGGVKKAIDVEIYNFRQNSIILMCIIVMQGGNWKDVAKMQKEVEDFIRKTIFTVGNYS